MIATGFALGALLGAVLQRGRFCVTGFLRDIYLRKTLRPIMPLFIVIAVQAVGIQALTALGIIAPEFDPFAPAAVIVGSYIFGIGIVLAGGCASGTWYRAGEGLVGSWLALVGYAVAAAAMKTGALLPLNQWGRSWQIEHVSIAQDLGVSQWVLVLGFAAATAVAVWNVRRTQRAAATHSLGVVKAQLDTPRWSRSLPVYWAAVLVGVLGIVAWPLSAAAGRNDGLGITGPSSNLVNFIVTGEASFLDWGVLLVLGILVGSLVAAMLVGEFRVRVPDGRTASASVLGGVLMGIGASWAGGCTVGNGMVQTSLMSYQGWVALVFIALGVASAARFYLQPQARKQHRASSANLQAVSASNSSVNAGLQQSSGSEQETVLTGAATALSAEFIAGVQRGVVPAVSTLHTPGVSGTAGAAETSAKNIAPDHFVLDSVGAVCPFPLLRAQQAIAELDSDQLLDIHFDCTQATEAIPQWAAEQGHSVEHFAAQGNASWVITLRKDGARERVHSTT